MAHTLCEKMAMRGAMLPAHAPFELYNKEFVQKCYLDECLLQERDIWILRAYMQNPNNDLVTTHIPTLETFALHTIDEDTVQTFKALNLDGYFSLPPWGPDIQRAYEVIHTYDPRTGNIKVTDFDGVQVRIQLTAELVKRALNFGDALLFTETRFMKEINQETSDHAKPKFRQLKHQRIRTALELFTQHFKLCYPQKFTKPEIRIARQFTLAALGSAEAKKDFSDFFCKEIKNAKSYKVKRGLYLGGVLALTRIAYMGLGRIDNLPPPLATTEELAKKCLRSSRPFPTSDQEDESNEEEDEEEGRDTDNQRAEIEFLLNASRGVDLEEQEVYRKSYNDTRRKRGHGAYSETLQSLKDHSLFREPFHVYMDVPMYLNTERMEVINLEEPSLDDLYQQEEEERLRRQAMELASFQKQAEEQAELKRRLEAQQVAAEEELRKQQVEAHRREQEGLFKLAEIKRKQEDQKLMEQQLVKLKRQQEAQKMRTAIEENMRKQQGEAQRREEEGLFQRALMNRKQEAWYVREWQLVVDENFRRQQVEAHRRNEEILFKEMHESQQLREEQLAVEEDIRRRHIEAQKMEAERLIKWKQEALQMKGHHQLVEEEEMAKHQVEAQMREEERLLKLVQEEQRQREESEKLARERLEVERKLKEEEVSKHREVEEKRQKRSRIRFLLMQHFRKLVQQRTIRAEESIKQSQELPKEHCGKVEAVAKAQAVSQSEFLDRMDTDGSPKELPAKKRRVDTSGLNGTKRVHFSEDASINLVTLSTSHEVEVEQDQLRKEVREGMKQIFSNIGTTVFQQFKVPQAEEEKEKIHPKVARLLNRTVDAVGKPVPGTALAKCFSEGAVDLCTTSLFENIFQMQAIVQIRETTLNRMIASLQQQLEETVIAVTKESRAKDEQIKMTALALEKIAKLQAEKDELGQKMEALLTEFRVDETKLSAMMHELKVLQAQKDILQKHLKVTQRELQATKATTAQFRAVLLEKELEVRFVRDKAVEANACSDQALVVDEANGRAVEAEQKALKALEQVQEENAVLKLRVKELESKLQAHSQLPLQEENAVLKQKVKELESKLQAHSQPPLQELQSLTQETGLPSAIRDHVWREEFPSQALSTVGTALVRQKVESDRAIKVGNQVSSDPPIKLEGWTASDPSVKMEGRAASDPPSETEGPLAADVQVRNQVVALVQGDYELYKLAGGQCSVKPLGELIYTLPKSLVMVHCEIQLKEWDEGHPENTRGGYYRVASETKPGDALEVQPPWRLRWFKRHPEHLDYYLQCPRELRVSSSFCPVPRRHTWKDFKKIQASNPEALNYPSLPETEEGQELTEEWFVSKIHAIEREYEGIPDPTILMLLKIMHMLKVCIEGFAEIKPQTNWHSLDFFGAGLAFTFGLGPMECQLHGYFARLQYLPAHFLNTFEEAFVTNFFRQGPSFVFGPQPDPVQQRWFAHQQFVKAFNGASRSKRNSEQESRYSKIQCALRFPHRLAVELGMSQASHGGTSLQKWRACRRQQKNKTRGWKLG